MGFAEAEEATSRLFHEACVLEGAVMALPAHTLQGLRIQAEIALNNEDHQEGQEMAWAIIRSLAKEA